MAVPKKKTSRSRSGARRSTWVKKLASQVFLALTIANSVSRNNSSFVFLDKSSSK